MSKVFRPKLYFVIYKLILRQPAATVSGALFEADLPRR